jgi:RES domain-containing protein
VTAPGCLDRTNCPVPSPGSVDLRRLRIVRVSAGTTFHTSYRSRHWPALFNPSTSGDARFSPLEIGGVVVATMYLARTQTVALLETSFHDVHQTAARHISEPLQLAGRGVVALSAPVSLPLVDLRDDELARLGLDRAQLVSTSPEHYSCTQEWGAALRSRRIGPISPVGILWRSRVAELAGGDSLLLGDLLTLGSEVGVLFGDRLSTDPTVWKPGDPHYTDLSSGQGRLLAEQIAEQLRAVIVPV